MKFSFNLAEGEIFSIIPDNNRTRDLKITVYVFMTPNWVCFISSKLWALNLTVIGTGFQKIASSMVICVDIS